MPTLLDYEGNPYYVPPSCPRTYHQFIWNVDTPAKEANVAAMIHWIDDMEPEDYRRAIRGNGDYWFIILELPEMETAFRLKFG